MNIDPSTTRLANIELAKTVAQADTTRSRTFSNSLSRAQQPPLTTLTSQPPQPTLPSISDRSETPFATPTHKAEAPTPTSTVEPEGTQATPPQTIDAAAEETSPPPAPVPTADLNNDGRVDVFDFGLFAKAFAANKPEADLFQDGSIDNVDFAVFKELFSRTV